MAFLDSRGLSTLIGSVGAAGVVTLAGVVLVDRELFEVEEVGAAAVVIPAAPASSPVVPGRSGTIGLSRAPFAGAPPAASPAANHRAAAVALIPSPDAAPPPPVAPGVGSRQASNPQTRAARVERRAAIARVAAILHSFETGLNSEAERALAAVIYDVSRRHNLDPFLTLAVIETESSFRNGAISFRGARGLMQIRPFVGAELADRLDIAWDGEVTLHDPVANVRMGVHYLAELRARFDDLTLALAAYNIGPNAVQLMLDEEREVPTGYVRKVLAAYARFLASAPAPVGLSGPATERDRAVSTRRVADARR